MNRTEPQFAPWFCADYFGLDEWYIDFMRTEQGAGLLWQLWQDIGPEIYESRLYLLREEIYRSSVSGIAADHRFPEFFEALDPDTTILDYGGGTGEYARLDWYDLGRRGDIYDTSELAQGYRYVKFKGNVQSVPLYANYVYKYDAIICMDVLEHAPYPLVTTEKIYNMLNRGGQLLVHFCTQRGIAGHLDESIDQVPQWLEWMREHFKLVKERRGCFWLEKL